MNTYKRLIAAAFVTLFLMSGCSASCGKSSMKMKGFFSDIQVSNILDWKIF